MKENAPNNETITKLSPTKEKNADDGVADGVVEGVVNDVSGDAAKEGK